MGYQFVLEKKEFLMLENIFIGKHAHITKLVTRPLWTVTQKRAWRLERLAACPWQINGSVGSWPSITLNADPHPSHLSTLQPSVGVKIRASLQNLKLKGGPHFQGDGGNL